MGQIIHYGIIVTHQEENIKELHAEAVRLFGGLVSPIIPAVINSTSSFFIAPDGGKYGWDTQLKYQVLREQFIAFLRKQVWQAAWVEVQYGETESGPEISRHYKEETYKGHI